MNKIFAEDQSLNFCKKLGMKYFFHSNKSYVWPRTLLTAGLISDKMTPHSFRKAVPTNRNQADLATNHIKVVERCGVDYGIRKLLKFDVKTTIGSYFHNFSSALKFKLSVCCCCFTPI